MPNRSSTAFEGVLDRYFDGMLRARPTVAAGAGLRQGEGQLGRAGREFEMREEKRRSQARAALEKISPRDLSPEQHLDRLALHSMLARESEEFMRGRPQLDPNALDHVLGILLHELQRGERQPARAAANIRSLLRETPEYLEEHASQVTQPERVWLRIMSQTADGAASLFAAVRTFLERHDPQEKDGLQITGAEQGFSAYRDALLDRAMAAKNSFAIGREALQRRVRDDLGLDLTLGQIETLALGEVRRMGGLLEGACRRRGPRSSAEEILEDARARWAPQQDLLELYRAETQRIAAAFRSARAMTFPKNDVLEVRPVPDFMRHLFPTAAYSAPGAFEREQRGTFWVNDLSVTKKSEAEKRAERAQHFGLSLTCAHEAYPGHHLQFVTANQHPRRWRRLFAHAVFYEGWTLWCEQMMVDLKIERSAWLKIQQLHDALWRCHRILVDVRLQIGRYTYEQAVDHMRKHLGFTRARAEADVNWYTGQAGVPMSYWLGRLENGRLWEKLVRGRGWGLRRFNDWLLSFGTLPQSWIERYGLE